MVLVPVRLRGIKSGINTTFLAPTGRQLRQPHTRRGRSTATLQRQTTGGPLRFGRRESVYLATIAPIYSCGEAMSPWVQMTSRSRSSEFCWYFHGCVQQFAKTLESWRIWGEVLPYKIPENIVINNRNAAKKSKNQIPLLSHCPIPFRD